MVMLTDLDQAVRKSGLPVVLVSGWKTRTTVRGGLSGKPRGILVHHTATSAKAKGNYPSLGIVKNGRSDLRGPLAQLGLGRDGTVYVIAAGKASHSGRVDRTVNSNPYCIGIEAEHSGRGAWPAKQYRAYVKLVAALVKHYGISISNVRGHKEAAVPYGRKPDPNFSMVQFRKDVQAALSGVSKASVSASKASSVGSAGGSPFGFSTPLTSLPEVPQAVTEDGDYGPRTHDLFMWYIGGNRKEGMSRSNWRKVQGWAKATVTGIPAKNDVKLVQAKVSAVVDGSWGSNTTLGLQRFLNKRLVEKLGKGVVRPAIVPIAKSATKQTLPGLQNADAVVAAAEKVGLPLYIAAALVEQESGGANVYGGDVGGFYAQTPRKKVTKENYAVFYNAVVNRRVTSNGVGPTQITYRTFHPDAKRKGLDLSDPYDNCVYGFTLFKSQLAAQGGSIAKAGTLYNAGNLRHGINSYGYSLAKKAKAWKSRLS